MQVTYKRRRIYMLLLIISFFLLGVSLIITWLNPAVTYEASIFLSTPKIYWVSLLFSLFIGFFIVIKFNLSDENRIYKNSALLLLFIAFASFLALWIIRGYYLWCSGDPLTHLGKINNILLTYHIDKDSIYPVTHIFLAEICSIFKINPIMPHKYVPLYFGIMYLIFMYLFAKTIFSNKKMAIVALLVAIIPMGGWFLNLTPNHLANLTLPLVFFILYQYITNRKYEWCILLIGACFFYPIFHPVPSLVLLLIVFALTPPILNLVERLTNKYLKCSIKFEKKTSMVITIIFLIWFITWVSSFYVWDHTIKNIYTLLTEGASTKLDSLIADAVYANSYGYSVIEQFLKVYGGLTIYLVLTAVSCIVIWKKIKQSKNDAVSYRKLISLITPLIIIISFMGLLYFTNLELFGPSRIEIYAIMISSLFVGYVLFECVRRCKDFRGAVFVSFFLVFLFVIGGLKLYPSPYILSTSYQITKTEMNGMDFVLRSKNEMNITSLSIAPIRYVHALLTNDERSKSKVNWKTPEDLKIPFHFGYDDNANLGYYYDEDLFMVLTYKDRILYKEVFPEIEHLRFTDDDFEEVENDNTITKFYANGGFDSYYICSYQDAITS